MSGNRNTGGAASYGEYLSHSDALFGRSMEVDVVRADSSRQGELQLLGLLQALLVQVGRPEGRRDADVRRRQQLVQLCGDSLQGVKTMIQ